VKRDPRVLVLVALLVTLSLGATIVLLTRDEPAGPPLAAPGPVVLPEPARAVPPATGQEGEAAAIPPRGLVNPIPPGPRITQTFTLQPGWNAIYLEVEPVNSSPLVKLGDGADAVEVHEKSTVEVVFTNLSCKDCLETVASWNVPATRVDYIVVPGEPGWDEPGWRLYSPASGAAGERKSPAAATLLNLRANTPYLVKIKGDTPATLSVTGAPVTRDQPMIRGYYNLAGFPLDARDPGTVAEVTAGSPITEVRRLTAEGKWGPPLDASATLAPGEAYLVYYSAANAAANATATDAFGGPLSIAGVTSDGLAFTPGAGMIGQALTLRNLSPNDITVSISLTGTAGSGVALRVTQPVAAAANLRSGPATVRVPAGDSQTVRLAFDSAEQPVPGQALLEITSPELGVRRYLPVRAEAGSLAGLWVGEVTVNDVSEGRLGATDLDAGRLTVALLPVGSSKMPPARQS
jgi:hypothetical protein